MSIAPITRIISSSLPLPSSLSADPTSEPAVQITRKTLEPEVVGDASRTLIFNQSVPSCNDDSTNLEPEAMPPPGIVMPNGVNIQFFEMAPRSKIPVHRTTSTDYCLMQSGEITIVTPTTAFKGGGGDRATFEKTVLKVGDVYLQRGSLHGWENNTDKWARFWGIMVASKENSTEVEGSASGERRVLGDTWWET